MLVCLACYADRVATLLETATELRLYRKDGAELVPCGVTPAPQNGVLALIDLLAAAKVDLLICGGVNGCAQAALRQSGVAVAAWIGGVAEDVARVWATRGVQGLDALRLPGCCAGHCQPRRANCRGRVRAPRPRRIHQKELSDE
ncbi:hypothetical protein SAMN04488503_3188 [Humidesulfovibrio mexicanus]|uniref:Dinitrogenase iron-molybdenum cofactor n=1 Tax=Humidesulfovibrio mexicanus TaxID=147047 RepID=A0A239CKV2_9BACT|nr:hypothetical protein [Humidesulfovibrio mexicanus]SNS20787.1 hypothetical protein SAMN04488503_3188 [Humidesulfovibrio mexicanus]